MECHLAEMLDRVDDCGLVMVLLLAVRVLAIAALIKYLFRR